MFTSPLAREMDEWCTQHLRSHDDPAYRSFLDHFAEGLRVKHDELRAAHDNQGRFGMSKAGGCTRVGGLKLLGYEAEPFSGSSLVTFEIGHHLEVMALAILRAMDKQVEGVQEPVTIDPMMLSFSDGILANDDGTRSVLSIKSTGYKFSAFRSGKWIRQGFTALPFEGIRMANPGWWAQAQAEMHGAGLARTTFVVVAKDIVKAFERDPYMQESGSLSWYCEDVEYDPLFCETKLVPVWEEVWDAVTRGSQRIPAYYYNPYVHDYVGLPRLADGENGWGGPNKEATGTFNPCGGCDMLAACRQAVVNARQAVA
ncbi:MAG: hypothetical protein KGL39_43455 [Patescibacteria group bacterium]|nr:hypothetical protein [Patescibacteria group bacterium]